MGLNCPRPEGSFYLFPDFEQFAPALRKNGIITAPRLCDTLLERAAVAVLPGSDFYLPATQLGVRVASVDYDGEAVLRAWKNSRDRFSEEFRELFPHLVAGCDSLERFLHSL
jgi:aspartate/methionine/tyrosine aminotransferase